ncbi:MAG: hypothetical protein QOF77_1826 [Solirubrobacteraceae bacterium]|nr:hypothetical protein [Solirubrobacteraceae bacterium]
MVVGAVIVILLLAGVVWLVGEPLRAAAGRDPEAADDGRPGLEAAKEAKYREIRDAEMDHRTGKLSPEDYGRLDRQLRTEAVEILRRLDELGPEPRRSPPGTASL